MNDQLTLQALCTLLIRDDPSSLAPIARERIEKWVDKKSQELGIRQLDRCLPLETRF